MSHGLAVLAQTADLASFLVLLSVVGPQAESNPLIAAGIAAGALPLVVVAKLAVIVALAAWPRTGYRYGSAVAVTGVGVGALGFASNVAAVWP